MAEQGSEVARAFVRIGGDDSPLKQTLAKSQSSVLSSIATMGGLTGGIVSTFAGGISAILSGGLSVITGLISSALLAPIIAAGGAFIGFGASLTAWTSHAIEAEEQSTRLNLVLKNMGKDSGVTRAHVDEVVGALAQLSDFGKGGLREAATELLKFSSIKGDNFVVAMKAAADFAAITKMDLASAAREIGFVLENPERAIRALAAAGLPHEAKIAIKTAVEGGDLDTARNIILGFFRQMEGSAEALSETTGAQISKIGRAFMGIGHEIGEAMLPIVKELAVQMTGLVKSFKPLFDALGGFLKSNSGAITGFISGVLGTVTKVIQFIITGIMNLDKVWDIITTGAELAFVKAWLFISDTFDSGGKYLVTVFESIAPAIQGIFAKLAVVIEGIFTNVRNFISKSFAGTLNDFISQILPYAAALAPLFPGLESVIAAPAITARVATFNPEKALTDVVKGVDKILPMPGGEEHDKLLEREKDLANKLDGAIADLVAKMKGLFPPGAEEAGKEMARKVLDVMGGFKGATEAQPVNVKFQFTGFADAWKKMQESITGGSMIDLAKQQLREAETTNDKLDMIGDKLDNIKVGGGGEGGARVASDTPTLKFTDYGPGGGGDF